MHIYELQSFLANLKFIAPLEYDKNQVANHTTCPRLFKYLQTREIPLLPIAPMIRSSE